MALFNSRQPTTNLTSSTSSSSSQSTSSSSSSSANPPASQQAEKKAAPQKSSTTSALALTKREKPYCDVCLMRATSLKVFVEHSKSGKHIDRVERSRFDVRVRQRKRDRELQELYEERRKEAEEATKRAEEANKRLRAEEERKRAELQAERERRDAERVAAQRAANTPVIRHRNGNRPHQRPIKEYQCLMCNLTLNSEQMYNDHIKGKRHLKRKMALVEGRATLAR